MSSSYFKSGSFVPRIHFFVFILVMVICPANALAQDDNFLRKWFPILFGESDEPGPEDTLVAPFAEDKSGKIRQNEIAKPKLGNIEANLNEAHLSHKEIQEWVVDKISLGMNFDDATFPDHLDQLRPHMTDDAVQSYINFLGSEGIYNKVLSEKKALKSVLSDRPVLTYYDDSCPDLISEFIQLDRYHWRFDVNIVYAIMDKNVRDFAQAGARSGRETIVRVLVSRAKPDEGPDGLVIKDWGYGRPC